MSRNKKNSNLTRQGVRNLDYIKGKSVGRAYVPPPIDAIDCDHKKTELVDEETGDLQCKMCGADLDRKGRRKAHY